MSSTYPCRLFLLPILFALALVSARAELIAYEPFDYATSQTETGNIGGSGWIAPWTYARAYPQTSVFTGLYSTEVVRQSGNMLFKSHVH
ncbi:MAG: hypothetical protein ABII82_09375, partial [Verrucomicrobiota bacterium]